MRKTTKLNPPHLPTISSNQIEEIKNPLEVAKDESSSDCTTGDDWNTIKTWAESLLNVKLNGVKDLVNRIKTNTANPAIMQGGIKVSTGTRKYAQREPKEKRLMTVRNFI